MSKPQILKITSWEKYSLSRQTISKHRKDSLIWVPVYVDSWLMGSVHFELEPDEQATFLDLLLLAAKDNGYIRANEITPYAFRFLAGYLNKPQELIERTIEKCLRPEINKLEIVPLQNCQPPLQDRQGGSQKPIARVEKSREEKRREDIDESKKQDSPSGYKIFVTKWFEFYEKEIDIKPQFSKKEGQQVKTLILSRIDGKKITLGKILEWLELYFADKDYELTKKNGYTIGGFNRWLESGLAGG